MIELHDLLVKMFKEGVRDETVVKRHRHALAKIAECATELPVLVDYDGREFLLTWGNSGREITFSFSNFSGRVMVASNAPYYVVDSRYSPANAEAAFKWLYQLYKKASNRKRKVKNAGAV